MKNLRKDKGSFVVCGTGDGSTPISEKMRNCGALVMKMVTDNQLPRILYCYQRFDPKEYSLDILRKKELWFTKPQDFNDPFDCKVYPSEVSPQYIAERANEANFDKNFTRKDLESYLSENKADGFVKQAVDKVLGSKGIKCFTPYPDKVLMWSHYAESHTGLCFEFDVTECPEFFVYPVKVKYEKDYPKIDFSRMEDINKIYSTKSKDWEYEEEYRVMKLQYGGHPYNPRMLKSIIFGCRTTEANIQKVRDIIHADADLHHIVLKQALPDDYSFRIMIKEYR